MQESAITIEPLKALNILIAQVEQQRDDLAKNFFRRHLSERLLFRRADGSVVGKGGMPGQEGFLESLDGPSPFSRRETEDIDVTLLGRAGRGQLDCRWDTPGRLGPPLSQHSLLHARRRGLAARFLV